MSENKTPDKKERIDPSAEEQSNAEELAARYNVCTGTITAAVSRRAWAHIE